MKRKKKKNSLIAHRGSIIDASFVEVPKQRNKKDENDDIKSGKNILDIKTI